MALTPSHPTDPRQVMREIDDSGNVVFSQVGFQELDFGAVFGGKTTSTTQNTIAYGTQTFTLDFDDGKILPGHTVQITALNDPSCFQYGVVLSKDDAAPSITVHVHTVSATAGTFSTWEIQIVDVARIVSVEVGDEDYTLEDHHRVVFYTTPLTAPRTLTLSDGATLLPGTRLLVVTTGGIFSTTNYLTFNGAQLSGKHSYMELIWDGSSWNGFNTYGFFWDEQPGSSPLIVQESDNSAAYGPRVRLFKESASPAVNDGLGTIEYFGRDSAGNAEVYSQAAATLLSPTSGAEYGQWTVSAVTNGVLTNALHVAQGVWGNGATGGDKGPGTFNGTNLYINGTAISASFQPLDATLTALAAYNTNGMLAQTAADTFTGRTITGTANQVSVSNGNGVSGNPTLSLAIGDISSGTYTPTLTNTTNIAASTSTLCQYLRVGNIVFVSGAVAIDPTAANANTVLGISLPIASDFTAFQQCGGTAVSRNTIIDAGAITGDITNNRAQLECFTSSLANHQMAFSFMYQIV